MFAQSGCLIHYGCKLHWLHDCYVLLLYILDKIIQILSLNKSRAEEGLLIEMKNIYSFNKLIWYRGIMLCV